MPSTKELAAELPRRIELLRRLIARKPTEYTAEWAKTPDESFYRYTNTRTINLLACCNDLLMEANYPFPGYLDLKAALEPKHWFFTIRNPYLFRLTRFWLMPYFADQLFFAVGIKADGETLNTRIPAFAARLFKFQSKAIFHYWMTHPALASRVSIIREIKRAYSKRMWMACVCVTLPVLDFVMREVFETDQLGMSIQNLRDAFFKSFDLASIRPGFSAEPSNDFDLKDPTMSDLRLVGVFLTSLFHCADRIYGWYRTTDSPAKSIINRHAVMHGAVEACGEADAVNLLTFFDLTLRLVPVLRILAHGEHGLKQPGTESRS